MSRIGLFCCLVVLYYVTNVRAIRFYLEPGQRRCFTEELPSSSTVRNENFGECYELRKYAEMVENLTDICDGGIPYKCRSQARRK